MKFDANNVYSEYKTIFSIAETKEIDLTFVLQFILGVGGFLTGVFLYAALVLVGFSSFLFLFLLNFNFLINFGVSFLFLTYGKYFNNFILTKI